MSNRIPRYLTRRRPQQSAQPWRPIIDALAAYGVTELVPQTTKITDGHDGISLDVFATGPDGNYLVHQNNSGEGVDIVTRRAFYPHPGRSTR
ncbi:hypothetical protein ACXET9_07155 [Brachybacterium sp. DNPG3]